MRTSLAIPALVSLGLAMLFIGTSNAQAETVVYQTANYMVDNPWAPAAEIIPLTWDGAPGQPLPGNYIGNQVTLAGTARFLDNVSVTFGNYSVPAGTYSFTCDLYKNDGSGGGPGTLLGTSTINHTWNTGDSNFWTNSFPFPNVQVPDTFTYVVSSGYAADSGNYFGPSNTCIAPLVGSGADTIWSLTDTGWVSQSTWAIADGATTNLFDATITAQDVVPEPVTMTLLGMGIVGLGGYIRRRAKAAK